MLNCYSLKLPKLSDELDRDLAAFGQTLSPQAGYDLINSDEINRDKQAWIDYHAQTSTPRSSYITFDMPPELQLRLKEEMTDDLFPFSKVIFYFQLITGGEKLAPHKDPGRKVSILYNVSADNAITHFYNTTSTNPDQHVFSLNEITAIESYQMSTNKWYAFNNESIHGVSNMFKNRIAVTSNLNEYSELDIPDYKSFCERYSYLFGPATTNRT